MLSSGPEPLVGGSAELTHLTRAFAGASSGNGSLTLVLGDAGAGKTRLIDEFTSAVSPVSFAWGRAVENATVAYRPWRQAFSRLNLTFPLADVSAALSPEERAGQLLQIAEDAVATLASPASTKPVVIAIDAFSGRTMPRSTSSACSRPKSPASPCCSWRPPATPSPAARWKRRSGR